MQSTCSHCQTTFDVTDDDMQFYDELSPVFDGKKCSLPAPTQCPDCRQQRRLAHNNEMNLSPGQCGLCERRTLTSYPEHTGKPYYCRECWNSDKWDPCDYGKEFDFNRPFFEQVKELKLSIPSMALNIQGEIQNSDYIHLAGSCKNSYLLSHADFCDECMYGYGFKKNIGCVDGFYNLHCEWCYDCIYIHKCYGLKGCQDCINCASSAFLKDCIGCQDCFCCIGLRDKKFCFENEQLSKEDYQKKMSEIDLGSYAQYQEWKNKRLEMQKTSIVKEFQGHNLQECSGNYLQNCKETKNSFDCEDVESGKFCYQIVLAAKNVYDIYQYGTNLQQSMECAICGENSYHLLFCIDCHMSCSDLYYCWYMDRCKDCFGCCDMHDKKFCILNKQYTEEEYNELVPKIIEHMKTTPYQSPDDSGTGQTGEYGEFFPMDISIFGYNKTTAQLYYPLTEEETTAKGLKWDTAKDEATTATKSISADQLPDNISETPDDILDWAIECEVTKKPYKIQKKELEFYRAQSLPIPHRCREERHYDRFILRNPRKLWERQCSKCNTEIHTTYAPDRPETVYCEQCFQAEVY
ncbi:MAG: hypothetical protein O2904_04410 [bacterium]|nr:hypothetical protein [bacterium]